MMIHGNSSKDYFEFLATDGQLFLYFVSISVVFGVMSEGLIGLVVSFCLMISFGCLIRNNCKVILTDEMLFFYRRSFYGLSYNVFYSIPLKNIECLVIRKKGLLNVLNINRLDDHRNYSITFLMIKPESLFAILREKGIKIL